MQLRTIFGPPGTGKTRRLIDEASVLGPTNNRVLFLSYTRAAAEEAGSRADKDHVRCSTIHALAYAAMGLDRNSVIDRVKMQEYSNATGIPFAKMDEEPQDGDNYASVLQYANNRIIDPWAAYDHFARPGKASMFRVFLDSYSDWKATYGYVDFDDMLMALPRMVDKGRLPPYHVVFLDEAQDCSPLQWKAFGAIVRDAHLVFVAGDDDQAIYEWSGADPHGMNLFNRTNGGTNEVLSKSWRLTRHVWSQATELTDQMSVRHPKQFKPRDVNGSPVVRYGDISDVDLRATLIHNDGSAMILARDRRRMREIQRILHDDLIPYTMGGAGPYENRWAEAIRGLLACCDGSAPTDTQRGALCQCGVADVADAAHARRWGALAGLDWRTALKMPAYLRPFYEVSDMRATPVVELSTIHGAKGKEADTVILDLNLPPTVQEGVYKDRDAELRVMYVGVTRARRDLILVGENDLL